MIPKLLASWKLVLVFIAAVMLIQHSSRALAWLVERDVRFERQSATRWNADVSKLPAGLYYVSLGRPRGSCDLRAGDQLLGSTRGAVTGVRNGLLLGGSFRVTSGSSVRELTIECQDEGDGSKPSLLHPPVVAGFYSGLVLQLWRALTDVYLGPVFSLILLFSVLLNFKMSVHRGHLLFGLGAFLYSISLAHFTRLLVGGAPAFLLHVILKYFFTLSFILLCGFYSRIRMSIIALFGATTVISIALAFVSPVALDTYYMANIVLFVGTTFWAALDLVRYGSQAESEKLTVRFLQAAALAWTVLQILDYLLYLFNYGGHIVPAFTVLMTSILTYLQYRELMETHAELATSRELAALAAQVAHDIRSPLAALDMTVGRLEAVDEDARVIIRGALARIRDIANNLLARNRRGRAPASGPESSGLRVDSLTSIVESLVTEKRGQYRARPGLEIASKIEASGYGLFARVNPSDLSRVLSNLINNAVEAIEGDGQVRVRVSGEKGEAFLSISDTGKGISESLLPKLMQRGASFGKPDGSGLGLYHARSSVESWGGAVRIASIEGEGTVVTIRLPRADAPAWFASSLRLRREGTIVTVDDEPGIHALWRKRLAGAKLASLGSGAELREWCKRHDTQSAFFLVDYELGAQATGLDLIDELGLAGRAALVTSRFEEPELRARCERLGVAIVPKPLADLVPIMLT